MVVAAFSKNLAYAIGGAERSLLEEVRACYPEEEVRIISCGGVNAFGAQKCHNPHLSGRRVDYLQPRLLLSRFFYSEYLLNRGVVADYFRALDADVLLAQNLWAPAALLAFCGERVYYLRDETSLSVRANYFSGMKKVAKDFYNLVDAPGFWAYARDNRRAILESERVVANSHFMAGLVEEKFGRKAEVVYPRINLGINREEFATLARSVAEEEKGIVLLGDSHIKGVGVFRKIAQAFPRETFYIFGRSISARQQEGNLVLMPWCLNPVDAYKYAKLVLVPSVWWEAFGRVAAEAQLLGLPVIVADRGGLPEAVGHDQAKIAGGLDDFIEKVKLQLAGWDPEVRSGKES